MKSRRILAVLPLVTLASAEQHYVRDQTSYDLNLTQLSQPCTEHFLTIGDTCGSLAAQYNVSVLDLDAFNKFTFGWRGCEQLVPGRAICLSPGAPPKTLPKEGAECGPEASGRECPLGACCSIDGKCGTTEEYCAAEECISDCFMPVIPATCDGSQISRKIGFYTGSKPVGDLNLTGYTHVIAASADLASDTITFKNAALTELPNSIRAHSSGVKALVSVVNWEERIRSSQGRASVLQNLLSLVTEHGWDGFDLAVNERYEGTDRIQLGDFIKELRRATGYQMIISASLPTAYDELRKCDIRGMNSQVSFVNMKSYALLDSSEALQLYMRAGLTLDKINVGVNDKIDRLLPFAQHSCVGGVNAWAVESLDMKVQAALHSLLTPVVDHSSSFNEAALSCFGDPAICDLPLPWIAFQGQHNAGAASLKGRNIFVDIWNSCHRATRRSYAGLLDDGVRWFNVDTCKDTGKGEVVNCHTDLAVGERMEDSLLQIFNWLKDMPNGEFAVFQFDDQDKFENDDDWNRMMDRTIESACTKLQVCSMIALPNANGLNHRDTPLRAHLEDGARIAFTGARKDGSKYVSQRVVDNWFTFWRRGWGDGSANGQSNLNTILNEYLRQAQLGEGPVEFNAFQNTLRCTWDDSGRNFNDAKLIEMADVFDRVLRGISESQPRVPFSHILTDFNEWHISGARYFVQKMNAWNTFLWKQGQRGQDKGNGPIWRRDGSATPVALDKKPTMQERLKALAALGYPVVIGESIPAVLLNLSEDTGMVTVTADMLPTQTETTGLSSYMWVQPGMWSHLMPDASSAPAKRLRKRHRILV